MGNTQLFSLKSNNTSFYCMVNLECKYDILWLFREEKTTYVSIGGSRGGREGRTPPPGRPNSFDFMQFSGKFGVFTPPLEGSRPPLGKILDPPLVSVIVSELLNGKMYPGVWSCKGPEGKGVVFWCSLHLPTHMFTLKSR